VNVPYEEEKELALIKINNYRDEAAPVGSG